MSMMKIKARITGKNELEQMLEISRAATLCAMKWIDVEGTDLAKICSGLTVEIEADAFYEARLMLPVCIIDDELLPVWQVDSASQEDWFVAWAKMTSDQLEYGKIEQDEETTHDFLTMFDKLCEYAKSLNQIASVTASSKEVHDTALNSYSNIFGSILARGDLSAQERYDKAHELVVKYIQRMRTGTGQTLESLIALETQIFTGEKATPAEIIKATLAIIPSLHGNADLLAQVRSTVDRYFAPPEETPEAEATEETAEADEAEAAEEVAEAEEEPIPEEVPPKAEPKPVAKPPKPARPKSQQPQPPQKPKQPAPPKQSAKVAKPAAKPGFYTGEQLLAKLNAASVPFRVIPSEFRVPDAQFAAAKAKELMMKSGVSDAIVASLHLD